MDKKVIYLFGALLICLLGLNIYYLFFGSNQELQSAIKDLKNAREEIAKSKQNMDSILNHSEIVLKRNTDFRNYIHAVDSIVKLSESKSRSREIKHLQTLGKLERNIYQLKSDLSKLNAHLPEPENGELSTQ
ncbi:MAG: hypothetical protein ACOVP1_01285 [Bacteroidia bacterium]